MALEASPWARHFWPVKRESRNPIFVFEFERVLFKFSAPSPALPALLRLPPRYGKRKQDDA